MSLETVRDEHQGNTRTVLDYALTTKALVDRAKQPGFSESSWKPLRDLLSDEDFIRVGNFKETMGWDDYVSFLTSWAPSAQWDCSFRRITEYDNLVFLELEERSTVGDYHSVVNSMSVYEFDDAGKIRRIDVYLQMALPSTDMLKSYDGVAISE